MFARTTNLCSSLGLFLIAAFGAGPQSHGGILDDIVFAYDMEGATGGVSGTIPDISGAGNDATILGVSSPGITVENTSSISQFSSPKYLKIAASDSAFRRIDTNNILTTATTGLSYSQWYNAQGDNGNETSNIARFLTTYVGTGPADANELIFDTAKLTTTRSVRLVANGVSATATATIPNADSVWHQIGFPFQGGATDGTVIFYFDGAPLGDPVTMTGTTSIAAQGGNWQLVEDLFAHPTSATNDTEFFDNSFVDEAALWTRALSAGEMNQLYTQGLTATLPEPSSLVLCIVAALAALAGGGCRRRR